MIKDYQTYQVSFVWLSPLQNFSIGILQENNFCSPLFTQLEHCALVGLYNAHMGASRENQIPDLISLSECNRI